KSFGPKTAMTVNGTAGGLALDRDALYYVETDYDGTTQRLVKLTLSPDSTEERSVLVTGTNLHAPALDATHVYLSRGGNLLRDEPVEMVRVPKAGGAVQTLATRVHVRGTGPFVVTADEVWFTAMGADDVTNLSRLPKTGGTPRTVDLGGVTPDAFTV